MKSITKKDLQKIENKLEKIRHTAYQLEERFQSLVESVHPKNRKSALNLLHYIALRHHNIEEIQWQLSSIGISSLQHAESHVMANVQMVLRIISQLISKETAEEEEPVSIIEGKNILTRNRKSIFGSPPVNRSVHIMVTLPTEAASQYELVKEMISAGMSCARINCAKDDEETWAKMIRNIRKAEEELAVQCKILMDLGGPKIRTGKIKKVSKRGAVADLDKESYLDEKTKLTLKRNNKKVEATTVGNIPAAKQYIFLQKGDILYLHHDKKPGEPPQYNDKGEIIQPGHIGCSLPEIFEDVKPGDPILFDDGKIKGKITEVSTDQLTIEITYAKNERRALKPDKGINLPASYLSVSGLTKKDLHDLDFVAKHADIANLSFVRGPKDVIKFLEELKKRNAENIGVMLKIETQRAVQNLPWLILYAMQHHPVSIMLARGDLAIETSWEEMAVLQDEILWLCEAAHVPIVWATQVLEGMAKKGLPRRSEITDAAMAHQADCVMLNKGKYIEETIHMLDDILQKMEKQKMKSSRLIQNLKFEDAFA